MDDLIGVVVNCLKMNIREKPDPVSKILCKVEALSEVKIDEVQSNSLWYRVCTVHGIEGFCMRKYVAKRKRRNEHGEHSDIH